MNNTSTAASTRDGDNGENGAEIGPVLQEGGSIIESIPPSESKPTHPLVGATSKANTLCAEYE